MNDVFYPYRVEAMVKTSHAFYEGFYKVFARSESEARERAMRELSRDYKTHNITILSIKKETK